MHQPFDPMVITTQEQLQMMAASIAVEIIEFPPDTDCALDEVLETLLYHINHTYQLNRSLDSEVLMAAGPIEAHLREIAYCSLGLLILFRHQTFDEVTVGKLIMDITNLLWRKNQDYGHSWSRQGICGVLVRISDKAHRVAHLLQADALVDESIEDTLRDMVGYSILGLIYLDVHAAKEQARVV